VDDSAREVLMTEGTPLILLSGMAADERLFEPQRSAFPNLRVPAWIEPLPGESLRGYAVRLARRVDPGRPCFVGGASFGGMVGREMAAHLQAQACFLIGSVRSADELPWWRRAFRPLASLGPARLGAAAGFVARTSAPSLPRWAGGRLRRFARPQASFVRWASCAALDWRPCAAARRVPVFQIHGGADRTLPVRYTRPDVVVPGGGHLLPLTHASAVNSFLRQGMAIARAVGACGRGNRCSRHRPRMNTDS
jgi:pimeloyl-ACP methyl ester carboxylesterase